MTFMNHGITLFWDVQQIAYLAQLYIHCSSIEILIGILVLILGRELL